ncbi:thiamine diphosphokinase [Pararhodobacter marinus]|uniref:Thiamine diphosphokinase n=1 Tax=Pararhodobacter marinus TaxID=2184063 RepID=A0A2U2C4P5_9RHOB|nr:thiamine diphosphokinase [Pararhodobacter marinus]PWE26811.1 thiamine diphosphokinase [Pararhodobacter marinus]
MTKTQGITLIGGGAPGGESLRRALSVAPHLVAADGGADAALALGYRPDLVVGDLDSLSDAARETLGPGRIHHDPDQETTDFDKVLAAVSAPVLIAVGFTGARLDHTLAAMSTLARNPERRLILDTGEDLCLLCPPELDLRLDPGTRVSLYPLAPLRCASNGLEWPTDPLRFDPLGRIGTSNAARTGPVSLAPAAPQMLLLIPVASLDALLAGLAEAPSWPALSQIRPDLA